MLASSLNGAQIAAVAFLLGAALTTYGVILAKRAARSRGWPSVRGRVVRSLVREETELVRHPDEPPTMYHPQVRYEYVVDGREYAATRIALMDRAASWRSYADRVIARYPYGREITVYYDPDDPRQAVLERDEAKFWAMCFVAGGVALVVGALAWVGLQYG
jgi:hypothetical protein